MSKDFEGRKPYNGRPDGEKKGSFHKDSKPYEKKTEGSFRREGKPFEKKGEGSFLNGRKLTMVDRPMEKGLVACGTAPYRLDLTDKTFETMKKVFLNSMDLRRVGSAALDLCYTAANRNVLFFEWVLMPWDYAAASLVITEAGGLFSQMDGSPVKPGDTCSILAGTETAVADFHRVTGI